MNVTIGLITIAHLIQTDNVLLKLAHIQILFLKDNRESGTDNQADLLD